MLNYLVPIPRQSEILLEDRNFYTPLAFNARVMGEPPTLLEFFSISPY